MFAQTQERRYSGDGDWLLGRRRQAVYARRKVTRYGHRGGRTHAVVFLALAGLVVVVSSGFAATSGRSATPNATLQPATRSFPGGPYFNVICGFSHRLNDDPIVFPGTPGRSHNHTFIGNRSVDASTTPESLLDGASTCDESDASTYWVPTLYEGIEPIVPLAVVVYYTRHTSAPVVSIPPGLKMVAGNQSAKRPQPKGIASWSCSAGIGKRFAAVPACGATSMLVFNLRFPNCWNGKMDSPDHKRHMAYSSAGRCPTTHPVRLPTIALVLMYAPTSRYARPASGKWGAHGDFMNGWDPSVLSRLVVGLNY